MLQAFNHATEGTSYYALEYPTKLPIMSKVFCTNFWGSLKILVEYFGNLRFLIKLENNGN